MLPRLVLLSAIVICILAPCASPGQDLPGDVRWGADIDYLIARLEITHPNLYANISRAAFLAQADALKRKAATATDVEMVFGIQELVARIGNAHTFCRPIQFTNGIDGIQRQFQYYPVAYYQFEDGLFVTTAVERYGNIVGKKVVKVGALQSAEAMRRLARFIGSDNSLAALANVPRWCLNDAQLLRYIGASDSPERITLTLQNDDGSTFDCIIETSPGNETGNAVSMSAMAANPPPFFLKHPRDNYWFEHLSDQNALYLQINLLNNGTEPFEDFCRRMFDDFDKQGSQKLIIDVRRCPGGDHIELPLLKGILARPDIDRADRLFLVIGRTTGSAAEHLVSELKAHTSVTLIGEPTASRPNQYGNPQNFTLPYSRLEVVCALDLFQDAKPTDYSLFSEPDIYVRRTSKDAKENRDPVMDRIADFDSCARLRSEFKARLTSAYSEGGMVGFEAAFGAMKSQYSLMGFNMENLLYYDLDPWMGEKKKSIDDYVEYLKFIHGELPNSIPVTYDLAYWMNDGGDREEAKRLYRKCLELNPEHHHASWRLGLIELEERRSANR